MNDLVLLGALAAGWYLFMRDTAAPNAAEPVPQPSPVLDLSTVERAWPNYHERAAGDALPPAAEKAVEPDRPTAGFFKSTVQAPRAPRAFSTPKVSNT